MREKGIGKLIRQGVQKPPFMIFGHQISTFLTSGVHFRE